MHQNHGSGITTFHICDTAILIGIALKGDWELLHYQVPILRLQRFKDCRRWSCFVFRPTRGTGWSVAKCGETMSSRFCFQCLDVNLNISGSGRYSLFTFTGKSILFRESQSQEFAVPPKIWTFQNMLRHCRNERKGSKQESTTQIVIYRNTLVPSRKQNTKNIETHHPFFVFSSLKKYCSFVWP